MRPKYCAFLQRVVNKASIIEAWRVRGQYFERAAEKAEIVASGLYNSIIGGRSLYLYHRRHHGRGENRGRWRRALKQGIYPRHEGALRKSRK